MSSHGESTYFDENLPSLQNIKNLPEDDRVNLIRKLKVNYDHGPILSDGTPNGQSVNLHKFLSKRHFSKQHLNVRRTKFTAMISLPQ